MDKIEGVILAAGFSSRANTFKLNLMLNGRTILENCIEGMYDICSKIIIVGGYNIEKIQYIPNKYPKSKLIFNQNYKLGMFSSVKKGISHVEEKRFFLTPGDYPLIKKDVYDRMANIDEDIIVPLFKNEKGHPVLIKSHLINEIKQEALYSNLKEFILSRGYTTVDVYDRGILLDVDTMEDYYKLKRK